MFTLNEARINRRGKGAKGSVVVSLLATVKESDEKTGVAKKFDYSGFEALQPEVMVEFVKSQGLNPAKLLAMAFDSIRKNQAIKGHGAGSELREKLITVGLAEKKTAPALAAAIQQMIRVQKMLGKVVSIDEVITEMVAQKKS